MLCDSIYVLACGDAIRIVLAMAPTNIKTPPSAFQVARPRHTTLNIIHCRCCGGSTWSESSACASSEYSSAGLDGTTSVAFAHRGHKIFMSGDDIRLIVFD